MRRLLLFAALVGNATACPAWCNAYTCGLTACSDCLTCAMVEKGQYCAGWCSLWLCDTTKYCEGCSVCGAAPANVCDAVDEAAGGNTHVFVTLECNRRQCQERERRKGAWRQGAESIRYHK